ncbi:hypothetical protein TNCV_2852091 [Trichonephila clavipes]|nr:hypothetical protein TNCV_2852091 [Trichonephila clavipes]
MSPVHRTIGGANACGFQSRVNEAMDALWTLHSAANGVEWYEQAPNDANLVQRRSIISRGIGKQLMPKKRIKNNCCTSNHWMDAALYKDMESRLIPPSSIWYYHWPGVATWRMVVGGVSDARTNRVGEGRLGEPMGWESLPSLKWMMGV